VNSADPNSALQLEKLQIIRLVNNLYDRLGYEDRIDASLEMIRSKRTRFMEISFILDIDVNSSEMKQISHKFTKLISHIEEKNRPIQRYDYTFKSNQSISSNLIHHSIEQEQYSDFTGKI